MKYCLAAESEVVIGVDTEPESLTVNVNVNGNRIESFTYDSVEKTVVLRLPEGEGEVRVK